MVKVEPHMALMYTVDTRRIADDSNLITSCNSMNILNESAYILVATWLAGPRGIFYVQCPPGNIGIYWVVQRQKNMEILKSN